MPEYWVIDRHRQQVVVFVLQEGIYEERYYRGSDISVSSVFPTLVITADKLLSGKVL
ncbi:MAG: Uma2 family endonuclease [Phormidesmis sp.]